MAKYKSWSMKELRYLEDNHGSMTRKEIAEELNRTYASVNAAAVRLGLLKKKKEVIVYNREDEIVAIGTTKEVAKELNIKESTLRQYRSRQPYMDTKYRIYDMEE